jgi:hypothetical protein
MGQLAFCLLLTIAAMPMTATTLSVVPLAEALKNSALEDTNSEGFALGVEAVSTQLLNRPASEAETLAFHARLSAIARHRETRVGKLFFAALMATPAIENLGESQFVAMEVTWPISLGANVDVRVEYTLKEGKWLISTLEVTAQGVAAAPVAGMAPYFGHGNPRPELLDLEALDYLVGRDPADREQAEADRAAFDFAGALPAFFEAEAGALKTVLDTLHDALKQGTEREKRIEALTPHLAGAAEVKAMVEADADPETRDKFWTEVREQISTALEAPRAVAVPRKPGAEVRVRWVTQLADGSIKGELSALRLETGKISPRGGRK